MAYTDRAELINRINEVFYKNGLELVTAEQVNTVLQLLLYNTLIHDESDFLSKIAEPVEDNILLAAADGTLKLSGIDISTITGIDFSRSRFTDIGGVAIKMRNLTPGTLYRGTICTAVAGSLSWQEFTSLFKPVGASLSNSDNYKYYLKVRNYYSAGTMHFQVNIYKDMLYTELVGHVPYVELSGSSLEDPQTIIEDNGSGLTGTIVQGTISTPTNELYEDFTYAPINAVSKAITANSWQKMVAFEDIAYGEEGWIVAAGAADVLMDNTASAEWGYYAYMDGNGRAKAAESVDTSSLTNFIKYFGRFVEQKAAGTDVLARLILK